MAFFDLAQYDDPRFLLDLAASTAREKSGNPTTVTNASAATHVPLIYGGDVSSVLSNAARVTITGLELVTPGSFEAWVREAAQGTTSILSSSGTDLLVLNGQKIQFTVNYPSGAAVAEYIAIDGQTYHVVGTIGTDQIMLYVNGEIVDAVELTDQQIDEQPILTSSLIAGQSTNAGAILADGLAYYEYPLDEEVIRNHYREGSPDKPLSEFAPSTGAAAFILTDDTGSISGLYDTDENMPWDFAEIQGLVVEDTLFPEMYDGLSTDGYCLFTIPLDASDNDILATSKIEWESTGSWVVEVSLDTLTWTTCENKNTVSVLTDNFNGVDKEVYVRISYPINLNEPDAEFKSLRVVFYSDRVLRAIGGPRPVVTVGAVSPADKEHDFIEMNDAAGLKFNGGTAYIDSIAEDQVFGIRSLEMTTWIPAGSPDFNLLDDDDDFFSVKYVNGNWQMLGATAIVNGVASGTLTVVDRNLAANPSVEGSTGVTTVKTNLVWNPSAEVDITGFGTNFATTGAGTTTRQTSGGLFGSAFHRITWTTANTVLGGGSYYAGRGTGDIAVTVGNSYIASGYVRPSKTQMIRCLIEWKDAASATISTSNGTITSCPANTWSRLSVSGTAPANTSKCVITFYAATGGSMWAVNDTLDTDGVMLTAGTFLWPYFDGTTAAAGDYTYAWSGTAHASNSIQRGPTANSMQRIGNSLTWTMYRGSDQAHSGSYSAKIEVYGTGSAPGVNWILQNPISTQKTVYWTCWARSDIAGTARPYGEGTVTSTGVYAAFGTGTTVTVPANTWVMVTGTAVIPADRTLARVGFLWGPSVTAGQIIWGDECVVTENPTPQYFAGDTASTSDYTYAWTGTAHASESTKSTRSFSIPAGQWNHLAFILDDNISMRNYVTNGDMQTTVATNVDVATNLAPDPQMTVTGGGNSPSPGTRNVEVQIDPNVPASLMTVRDSTLASAAVISSAWFAGTNISDARRIQVTPGTVISAAIRVQTDQENARARLTYGWRDAAGAVTGTGGSTTNVNLVQNETTELKLENLTVPTGAVILSFGGIVETVDGISPAETGAVTYWAGVVVTQTPKAQAYFDGSLEDFVFDYAWTGTANSSTSTKTGHPVSGFTLASNVVQYQDIDSDGLWVTIRSISSGADSAYLGAIDGIVPGNQYTFSVDVKTDYAAKIALQFADSAGTAIGTAPVQNITAMPGVVQRITLTATAPALSQKFRLFAYGNDDVIGNEVRYSNFSLSEGTDNIFFDSETPGAALVSSVNVLYGPQGKIVIGGPDNMRVGYLTYYSDKLTTAEVQTLYNALIGKTVATLIESAITAVSDSPIAPQFYAHDWSFTGAG